MLRASARRRAARDQSRRDLRARRQRAAVGVLRSDRTQVALAASVHVDRFDYGVLARRLRPGTDLAGLISLDLELTGKAPTLSSIMAHADGRIDVAVWPKNLRGGVIDRWSVNVFFALLPFVDSTPQAHVNCAIFASGPAQRRAHRTTSC